MKPVRLHRAAEEELRASAGFYEKEGGKELAFDFERHMRLSFEAIARHPELYPFMSAMRDQGVRKFHPRRFPFVILYINKPEVIWIVAVMHTSRRPLYWKGRVK